MPITKVLSLWKRFSKYRVGKWLFSYLIRFINPYTDALGAKVDIFEAGHAEVILEDHKINKNHLNSVHAVALTNLGEFTSGIAVMGSLKENVRGIVSHISIDFIKKARGVLKAVSRCETPEITGNTEFIVYAEIFNSEDELVSRIHVTWQLGLYNE